MTDKAVFDDGTILSVPSSVLSRKAGDEIVLLDLDSEEYFGLDGVGTRAWELVEDGTTFGALVEAILAEYAVEPDALRGDLGALIIDLRDRGLVLVDGS